MGGKYWVGQKFIWVFHTMLWKNPYELFGKPYIYIYVKSLLLLKNLVLEDVGSTDITGVAS